MYRAEIKPWNSAGWRPSEKHIHEKAVSATEVREEKDTKDADSV